MGTFGGINFNRFYWK